MGEGLSVIYTRLSETGENHALQEADCRRRAERDGVTVDRVLTDDDRSAWDEDVVREQFEALLKLGAAGKLARIYAWKIDRLCRRPEDLVRVEKLARKGVEVLFADGTRFENGMGAAVAYLNVLAARHESDVKSERVRRKMQDNAERGKPTGPLTWGVRTADERELIQEATKRVLAGEALNAVAEDWNARGIRGTKGSLWNGSRIGRILRRPAIAGLSVYKGEIVARGEWEAAITEDDWRRLCDLFDGRDGGVPRTTDPALLSGLIYCGRCGYRMTTRVRTDPRTGAQWRMYACYRTPDRPACRAISVACHRVEREVGERFLVRLREAKTLDALGAANDADPADERSRLEQAIDDDRVLLKELDFERFQARSMDRERYLANKRPIEERIRENERVLASLDVPSLDTPSVDEVLDAWESAPDDVKRSWLRPYLERVYVDPVAKGTSGRVFDADRVRCEWLR